MELDWCIWHFIYHSIANLELVIKFLSITCTTVLQTVVRCTLYFFF